MLLFIFIFCCWKSNSKIKKKIKKRNVGSCWEAQVTLKLTFRPLEGSSTGLTHSTDAFSSHKVDLANSAAACLHIQQTRSNISIRLQFLAARQLLSVKYRHQHAPPPSWDKKERLWNLPKGLFFFSFFLSFDNKNYVSIKQKLMTEGDFSWTLLNVALCSMKTGTGATFQIIKTLLPENGCVSRPK